MNYAYTMTFPGITVSRNTAEDILDVWFTARKNYRKGMLAEVPPICCGKQQLTGEELLERLSAD